MRKWKLLTTLHLAAPEEIIVCAGTAHRHFRGWRVYLLEHKDGIKEAQMEFLKRAGVLVVGTAFAVMVGHATAEAQSKEIRGSAVAVSDSLLTVKAGEQTLSFVISKDTLIEARGAGTRSRRADSVGNSPGIKVTDYLKAGDPVLVSYRAADGKNLALTVRPISAVGTTGAAAETQNVQAKVKSISGNALILDRDGRDMRFTLDRDTDVFAIGATRATKKAGGSLPITDLVHAGDIVWVEYLEAGGSLKAREIQVRMRGTVAVK